MQKVAGAEVVPEQKDIEHQEHGRLFHVVLLDDDEHTYDYVIEMLQKLFVLSKEAAFRHAVEVDSTGKTIVITCRSIFLRITGGQTTGRRDLRRKFYQQGSRKIVKKCKTRPACARGFAI